jgi:ATPase subunit of ABC transporter with duplicated ATPase domains
MLSTYRISKNYGINTVLQNITFSINSGDRIGLIGPNGCGKSTLMHILIGLETADTETIAHTRPDLKIGYLSQGLVLDPRLTIAQVCALDIPSRTRFEQALGRYTGTVLAVIHDRYFVDQFATQVLAVEKGKIRQL